MLERVASSLSFSREPIPGGPRPTVVSYAIHSLPGTDYELLTPVPVVLEYEDGEVIASIPELEIFADGPTAEAAVAELKLEFEDLTDMLFAMEDKQLGEAPRAWKKMLAKVLRKCR
jgi:hypothetical protein